jgi:capsular polysaccharide biosynthesis protein
VSEPDPSILRYYLGIIWRWKWLLAAPVVAVPVIALVLSLRQASLYATSADVLLNHQDQVAASLAGVQTPVEDPGRYAVTQTLVARSPVLGRRVLAAVGKPGEPAKALFDHSSVASNADVLQFYTSNSDADFATRLANAYVREYTAYRRQLDTQELAATLASLTARLSRLAAAGQASSSLYTELAGRQEQIRLLEALRKSNVYVIRTASVADAEQIAPRPKKDVAYGVGGGLLLGLLLIAIANAFDRRVHDTRELEAAFDAPLLARTILPTASGSFADEGVRLAALISRVARSAGARSVLLTTVGTDEQTELTAAVAEALANMQSGVLLVDADLRSRGVTRRYELDDRRGLADVAREPDGSAAVVVSAPGDGSRLRIVPAGREVPHAGALLASEGAARALGELARDAELTLVAGAPIATTPEAPALAAAVDSVLLLVDANVERSTVAEVRRVLHAANTSTLGFVLLDPRPRRSARFGRGRTAADTAPVAKALNARAASGEVSN